MIAKISEKSLFIAAVLLFVAFSRLLPHLPNFTPVAAMALFGGAMLRNTRSAYLLTFAALLLSDVLVNVLLYNDSNFLNYFSQPFVWAVYFSFGLTVFMGSSIKNPMNVKQVALYSISSSLIFWIITNFACWPNNPLYTQDFSGIVNCYIAAIPFLGNILGDLFYNTILFSALFFASKKIPALVKA
jgi:hypothetical protein